MRLILAGLFSTIALMSFTVVPSHAGAALALSETTKADLAVAHDEFIDAMLANDAVAIAETYTTDAISLPSYQPTLIGLEQVEAYWQTMTARRPVTGLVLETSEVFDLGNTLVEIGEFSQQWTAETGESAPEPGYYTFVWKRTGDGQLRLKADAWNFSRDLEDAGLFRVDDLPAPPAAAENDSDLGMLLAAQNVEDARNVLTYDAEAKIARYTQDGIYMPFADTAKVGMDVLRPHFIAYTDGARAVTLETVDVWNIGFEDLGDYVLEYGKFQVLWSTDEHSATVTGGGIRLWQRQPDGTLLIHRHIATHDYRP